MLASPHRLTKDKEIKKVLVQGRSFFSPYFKFQLLANDLSASRFAVVVSARVSKKATQRNLLRRRIQEIIRLNLKSVKPGYDVLISLSQKALAADYQELEEKLLTNFKKAKLLL